jgi:hypothetical protein
VADRDADEAWDDARRAWLDRVLEATPAQRLAWLEQAIELAYRTGALPARPRRRITEA